MRGNVGVSNSVRLTLMRSPVPAHQPAVIHAVDEHVLFHR